MIYQVGDKSGVYCIENAGNARVYFVAPEATLIDAGEPGKADRILSALANIGVQPLHVKRIILTHHHYDHVGSVWELKRRTGAQIIAHHLDAEYIAGKRPRRAPRQISGRVMFGLFNLFGARNVPGVDVDQCLRDGETIGKFSVVYTPGHTPGHICLLREGYLFTGDLMIAKASGFDETPHVFTADVPTSRQSIRLVAGLKFDVVLSAHHPPVVFGATGKMRELADRLGTLP